MFIFLLPRIINQMVRKSIIDDFASNAVSEHVHCDSVSLRFVMNAMMKRIIVVLSNPFVILAIVNMLFACRIVWVIKNTCFLIHPGEIVYKFPLIEENYNVMIGGILMNIFFVGILLLKLRKKSIVEQYDLKCCMFYNIITFLLIAWGYWHLFDTIHDRIITEYNPLFQFWLKVMNMQFLGNPKYVMYVYGLLTTMLIGLNIGFVKLLKKKVCSTPM